MQGLLDRIGYISPRAATSPIEIRIPALLAAVLQVPALAAAEHQTGGRAFDNRSGGGGLLASLASRHRRFLADSSLHNGSRGGLIACHANRLTNASDSNFGLSYTK